MRCYATRSDLGTKFKMAEKDWIPRDLRGRTVIHLSAGRTAGKPQLEGFHVYVNTHVCALRIFQRIVVDGTQWNQRNFGKY